MCIVLQLNMTQTDIKVWVAHTTNILYCIQDISVIRIWASVDIFSMCACISVPVI